MSLLGPQSFKSPHYLNDQYHANFCILPADQIKKWIEENQKKEVCTGEIGKRQTTQSTTELWNLTQTDFGQGQPTSGRLLGEMMREEETHRRPWVSQELDSSHGAMQRYASLSPQSTAQVSRLRDYTRNSAATSTPLCAPSARKQEWNYFSMWSHTKIKSIYTSLLTTQQQRHGIADFRTVPLTIDWAFPCQSIKTTPPLPTPYKSTGSILL